VNGRPDASRESVDLESQKSPVPKPWFTGIAESAGHTKSRVANAIRVVGDPKCWDRKAIWDNVIVAPVACLPAVIVGLLLNILDALSYGQYNPIP
jgi:SulP family sulfate permease